MVGSHTFGTNPTRKRRQVHWATPLQTPGIAENASTLDKRRKRFGNDGFGGVAATEPQLPPLASEPAEAGDEDSEYESDDDLPDLVPQAKRPPRPLSHKSLAAAVRTGMQSAGLAWLVQAGATDAASSTAEAPSAPPNKEQRGRAAGHLPQRHQRGAAKTWSPEIDGCDDGGDVANGGYDDTHGAIAAEPSSWRSSVQSGRAS